ncbi:MAG: hypothetical protein V7L31_23075 [Nostoc sp.]|uniref:hypothetical protein n=1 Tax=Nostoc sp. TaxID=1180 RepID=UPI002FEF62FB
MLHDLNFISGKQYIANVDGRLGITATLLFNSIRISTTRSIRFEFYKEDGDSVLFDAQEVIKYFGVDV